MNKRKAKKRERNAELLRGMSYNECRKNDRCYKVYLTHCNHAHKTFKGFDEEEKALIELGLFTPKEIMAMYGNYNANDRWRQRKKLGACIFK